MSTAKGRREGDSASSSDTRQRGAVDREAEEAATPAAKRQRRSASPRQAPEALTGDNESDGHAVDDVARERGGEKKEENDGGKSNHGSATKRAAPSMTRYFAVSDSLCSNCGLRGHVSWNCPEPEAETRCFLCGRPGHLSKDCDRSVCYACGELGHKLRECPKQAAAHGHRRSNGGDDRGRSARRRREDFEVRPIPLHCYVCGGDDHLDCSLSRLYPARVSCYNCGAMGHAGPACGRPNAERTLRSVSRLMREDSDGGGGGRRRRRSTAGADSDTQKRLADDFYARLDEDLGISSRQRAQSDGRSAPRANTHIRYDGRVGARYYRD